MKRNQKKSFALQDNLAFQEMRVNYFESEIEKCKIQKNAISRKIDIFEHQKLSAMSDMAKISLKAET